MRGRGLARHAGQISLPGGAADPGETLAQAALREASEEIGVDPSSVRVLGELTPVHVIVSGFTLHPVVGVSEQRPDFIAAPHEVEEILEVSLDDLRDARRSAESRFRLPGRPAVAAAAILVLLLVGGAAWRLGWLRGAAGAPRPRNTVLLSDIANGTGDPDFDGTLRQAVGVYLGQSPYLDVVSDELNARAQRRSQAGPPRPVGLAQAVFNRDDRILPQPVLVHRDHLVRRPRAFA